VNTKLLEGFGHDLSSMLLEEAKKFRANLIVMGTHGRKGLMHLIMGSVAEGVVRRSTLPVLLVRDHESA
jgi:nucleotide-binding universal stress UspA family protein